MDAFVTDKVLVGPTFSYENLDLTAMANGGGQDVGGFRVAPCVAALINDYFSAAWSVLHSIRLG